MKSLVPNHPLWPSDGLTPVNDAHQMTLRVSKTQVSPVALFDDANLVQTMELGRCCGRHDGDLSQRVPVYDATELGLLQAGFNHMAEGLAEREHLRDLFGRHVGQEVARAAASGDV